MIAEADVSEIERLEGNVYFPSSSLKIEFFNASSHTSVCSWKGTANYYNVSVDGKENKNAAWVYHTPSEASIQIKNLVAFWKGVQVVD